MNYVCDNYFHTVTRFPVTFLTLICINSEEKICVHAFKCVCLEFTCLLLLKVIRHFTVETGLFIRTYRSLTLVRNQCNLKNKSTLINSEPGID